MNSDPHMKARNQRKLLLNTQRQESTDCLVWNGQISNGGYGRVMLKTDDGNKTVSASRAAYQLFIGPVHRRQYCAAEMSQPAVCKSGTPRVGR